MRTMCVILLLLTAGDVSASDVPAFTTDVRPILAANCLSCHGADEKSREADLRLDIAPDTETHPSVIVPGEPENSELIARITSNDPDLVMPPADSGHSLTKQQINILTRWIAGGAAYEQHWAFVPPARTSLPENDDRGWCRSPLDTFVLNRMMERGLSPSVRADPYTLIRRVYLDLTGLPPTPAAADAFAANPTDEAFESIVDELLRSPRFGEHWAAMWLDLARYADTKGYEKDQPRNIWRYRDWVIRAFNEDMPFDQFTTEQLAGDLLENATTDQILATAFHRNTMTNDEGGTDNEEFRLAAVKDRVDTTVQVWMGLTMGCAKCHSHKYDPVSQQEYYQFLAYFNQTEDADRPDDNPRIPTPTPEQQQRQAELDGQLEELKAQYEQISPEFAEAQTAWEDDLASKSVWSAPQPVSAISQNGSTLTILPDQSILASGTIPPTDVYEITFDIRSDSPITAIRIEAMTDESLPRRGPGRNEADPNFVLSELSCLLTDADGVELSKPAFKSAQADFSQNNWQVAKAIDGNPETGWAVSPQFGKRHAAIFAFAEPVTPIAGQRLTLHLSQQYKANRLLMGRVRVMVSSADPNSLDPMDRLAEYAALPRAKRTPEQKATLTDAFRRIFPATSGIAKEISTTQKQLADLKKEVTSTPVMRDLPAGKQRKTHIHLRGNFLDKGDEVHVGFPAAFPAGSNSPIGNRLDVAAWLLSESNPLTARVMANRIWSRLYGRGLVETEEDFGTQGMLPTHPDLLDWLALEFRETHRWSLKQLCRTIVLSATYQQSSVVTDESKSRDPENTWLSRGARFRLPAESIRDQSLAVAGLLSDRIGGPSVMPPQPPGIWRTTYSKLKWQTPDGEDRYRRGIYTFLRRTSPYPSLITFDGTSREVCQVRRIRTNTPLQALILMNDPVYLEAAGALAERSADPSVGGWLERMFRLTLIRKPTKQETTLLLDVFNTTKTEFQDNSKELRKLVTETGGTRSADVTPAAAARIVVASVLLNLDETLTRP